jgi:phenylpropionate dioxygenase-like ring-hydroxylating dioxygenase large terminal subunit
MIRHLSMKPTGWFQIGWSAEIPPGAVKPLKYFGQDLVAFRSLQGELSVLDAHCLHMGAHLGYGGHVVDDCIACPYHGWRWRVDGTNALIPYEDHTIRKQIRRWSVVEKHEIIFLWHDPAGGPPREGWLPDLFDLPDKPARAADFYPSYSNQAHIYSPNESLHPQVVVENSADTMHFRYSHGAPEDPVLLWFKNDGPIWRSSIGFRSPKTKEVVMRTVSYVPGVGLSFTIFDHRSFARRLVLACTPVDDQKSDLRVTYFFPRDERSPEVMPEHVRAAVRETAVLFEQDARIWRHQKFVQRPIFAKQDVQAYTALRKWCDQFYEIEGSPVGPMSIAADDAHAT